MSLEKLPDSPFTTMKEWFDIIIIVPLEEELLTAMKVFPAKTNRSTAKTFRYEVEVGNPGLNVLLVQQEGMGRTHAARAASEALSDYDAGLVVCLGIAGGLSKDIKLGDVCYSNNIADVLDNARAVDTSSGQMDLSLSLTYFSTPREIVAAFNFSRILPELKGSYEKWRKEQNAAVDELGLGELPNRTKAGPNSMDGLMVCAAVSKSENYNQKLRAIDRKVLAIETESGGIFEEATRRGIPAVTIRGISDMADLNKSALEKDTDGGIRKIAAQNASTFLKLQFQNPYLLAFLNRRRLGTTMSRPIALNEPDSSVSDLAAVISSIGEFIDIKLRELSPDFRLLTKGYRLPTPRMRCLDSTVSLSNRPEPCEIREALQTRSYALLRLARSYPDDSVPWVLANDLLTSELNGKQPIPIVVSGESLGPPNADFRSQVTFDFHSLAKREGVQLVFIFDELPFTSRSRLKYIEEQIKEFPEAKFFFITRAEPVVIADSSFSTTFAIDTFELSSISFSEIFHFVQKNFGMTGSESEVIALRLRDTFRHFDLSAHPSYFAGIPRETLSALLQANRRAELIQLAVDGFLTFVVAGDKAEVTLSRTTRARFLKRLAVELNVEKRAFNEEQVVAFAKEFSIEFDFGIDPLAFVQSFIEAGILHFERQRIEFSLPFIEHYVLASELALNQKLAERYFVLGPDFDLNTFDLYSEIGAADSIVCKIIEGLEDTIQTYGLKNEEEHIYLTDRIRPFLMSDPGQVENIQRRLNKTAEDIELVKGDVRQKQRMLDVADRVREEVAATTKASSGIDKTDEEERVSLAIQNWLVANSLLGAGAEHLSADLKQMLASLLIKVSSVIAHRGAEAFLKVDFAQTKKRLQSDKQFRELLLLPENKDEAEIQRYIGGLVDVLEYSLLAAPIRRVLHQLCEGARQRVLATSVEKAEIHGPIESLIHGAWLTDIESHRARDKLLDGIKLLPGSPFLRSLIAAHFLTRVYWSHWRKEDRLALLNAAEEALKGVGLNLKKGELKRMIEKTDADINAKKS